MKVLLTSGGTKVKIDDVRHVGNFSAGTFGNHLCHAFLEAGHDVTFLYAKGSKCPHELRLDLSDVVTGEDRPVEGMFEIEDIAGNEVAKAAGLLDDCRGRYHPVPYSDFEDYAVKLDELLRAAAPVIPYVPDVVVLAAAVSDYAPVKREGKISSELDEMTIRMEKTPKLIRKVKDTLPECFLVGFKLLVGSTQKQLQDAMVDQHEKARADMVVGNDLRDIRTAQHKLTTLSIDQHFYEIGPMPGDQLAAALVEEIVRDAKTMNGDFAHLGAPGREG